MGKVIHCSGCNICLGEIANGSKLKNGMVFLCEICEFARKIQRTSGSMPKLDPKDMDLFNGLFGTKEDFDTGSGAK